MSQVKIKRTRLSIDISSEEHQIIKLKATLQRKTIRDYVVESIRERLRKEAEDEQLSLMTGNVSPVLKGLWDNVKDAYYDNL